MKNKWSLKTKITITTIIAILFTSLGFFAAYKLFVAPKSQPKQWVVPNLKDTSNKFMTKDTIVKEVSEKRELITMETGVDQEITIDNSWGNWEIFKKMQSIQFHANGIYSIDLSKVDENSLKIDKNKKTITLYVNKPSIKSIAIDEQKTLYKTPEKGLFRFGEVNLTPEEYTVMMSEAKKKIAEKMNSKELYDEALKNTQSSLTKLMQSLFSEDTRNNYKIIINFKEQ